MPLGAFRLKQFPLWSALGSVTEFVIALWLPTKRILKLVLIDHRCL